MQGTQGAPKAPLGNNARPPQPLHQRTIRTNINFQNSEVINHNIKYISYFSCELCYPHTTQRKEINSGDSALESDNWLKNSKGIPLTNEKIL